jgi:hypothetical protein
MTAWHDPAAAEEQAELHALRSQADAAGREVADTVAALADRLTAAASPRAWARNRMAEVRARARRAARRAAGMPVPTGRLRLGGTIAAFVVVTVVAFTWQRHRRA